MRCCKKKPTYCAFWVPTANRNLAHIHIFLLPRKNSSFLLLRKARDNHLEVLVGKIQLKLSLKIVWSTMKQVAGAHIIINTGLNNQMYDDFTESHMLISIMILSCVFNLKIWGGQFFSFCRHCTLSQKR